MDVTLFCSPFFFRWEASFRWLSSIVE